MKKINDGIFENTHVTTCWRQQYVQSEKVEFLKFDCTNESNVKKEVKVTKDHMLKINQSQVIAL